MARKSVSGKRFNLAWTSTSQEMSFERTVALICGCCSKDERAGLEPILNDQRSRATEQTIPRQIAYAIASLPVLLVACPRGPFWKEISLAFCVRASQVLKPYLMK